MSLLRFPLTHIPRRQQGLFFALIAASIVLGLQRGWLLYAESRHQTFLMQRTANAVRSLEVSRELQFRGELYSHTPVSQATSRSSEYGQGEEANSFLVHQEPLRITDKLRMRITDLHLCPDGHGLCSYSGMAEILVDSGEPIVVDICGLGTNDANSFSVRDGVLVMDRIAASLSSHASAAGAPAATMPHQAEFLAAIRQCWLARHSTAPLDGSCSSDREESLQQLERLILNAIFSAWREHGSATQSTRTSD